MRILPVFLAALTAAWFAGSGIAQDTTLDTLESEGRNLLSDPRLQNVIRPISEDPESLKKEATKVLDENADQVVREATRLFKENEDEITAKAKELASDPEALEATATSALNSLTNMLPAPPPSNSEVPATRPANTVTVPIVATEVEPVGTPDTPPSPVAEMNKTVAKDNPIESIPDAAPTTPNIPTSPYLGNGDVPAPEPITPIYRSDAVGRYRAAQSNQVEITSLKSIMDEPKGMATFSEDVVINHPEFILTCDKLDIYFSGGGENEGTRAMKRAVASGGMVEIRRISPEGKTQIAMARKADYNGVTKDIVLSGGPPYIQDGDRFVKAEDADAQIMMTGDGKYKIMGANSSGSRHRMVFPVDDEGQDGDIGIGAGLGDTMERLR